MDMRRSSLHCTSRATLTSNRECVSSPPPHVTNTVLARISRSDAVFGVKTSLIVDPVLVEDEAKAKAHGFKHGPFWHLKKDYVLLTTAQAEEQKKKSLANYYASLQ